MKDLNTELYYNIHLRKCRENGADWCGAQVSIGAVRPFGQLRHVVIRDPRARLVVTPERSQRRPARGRHNVTERKTKRPARDSENNYDTLKSQLKK